MIERCATFGFPGATHGRVPGTARILLLSSDEALHDLAASQDAMGGQHFSDDVRLNRQESPGRQPRQREPSFRFSFRESMRVYSIGFAW